MSDNASPLVGIALAAYKPNILYFVDQLRSIAEQTYSHWFCIVTLDSNLDDIRREPALASFFLDSRFSFRQNSRQLGATENFQAAADLCAKAGATYIAFSDQDDIWFPHKLARQVEALAALPLLSVVHCDMRVLMKSEDGSFAELVETAWTSERRGVTYAKPLDFLIRNMAAGAGMLLDANLVRKFPAIPAREFGHDHWYPLIASYVAKVHPIHEALYAYRIHGANVAGLSNYPGLFAHSKSSRELGFIKKCLRSFNLSQARYADAKKAGLPTTSFERVITTSQWDFGFFYFLYALTLLLGDPALARACLARGLGKVFRIFNPKFTEYSAL